MITNLSEILGRMNRGLALDEIEVDQVRHLLYSEGLEDKMKDEARFETEMGGKTLSLQIGFRELVEYSLEEYIQELSESEDFANV
jgi:hypothetical protein